MNIVIAVVKPWSIIYAERFLAKNEHISVHLIKERNGLKAEKVEAFELVYERNKLI